VPIGWLIFVILLGVGAVASFITNASRSDTGEIVNEGDMMATDLRVGDCFDLKDPTAEEISDVTARPCTDPHEYELFWTGSMAEGDYPTQAAFESFFETHCIGAFQPYVGTGYLDSQLDISWLTPLEDTWGEGDRSIQCAVYDPENAQLTGSVKASAR
jgi:Septum formation